MKNRIDTRKNMVGNVQIGGNNHVVIQSMTNIYHIYHFVCLLFHIFYALKV